MEKKLLLVLACLLSVLSACTEPEEYPVSGEQCEEGDPVQSLDARDCLPPTV